MDVEAYVADVVKGAREAAVSVARASSTQKNAALLALADGLLAARERIQAANAKDLEAGRAAGLSAAMLDRLELTDARIQGMADGLRKIVALPDPVGRVMDGCTRPNGLRIDRVRVPLGVVCIIYESRPNVTADAAALCLKSGNAAVLRGGKEAVHSNLAIAAEIAAACESVGLDPRAVQVLKTTDRAAVPHLLRSDQYIDVVIPRGGKSLIRTVVETSTIPVIKHYEGVCHVFVDASADLDMAVAICENAKCQRPGTCNAMETLLVHADVAEAFFERMHPVFQAAGVELRGCAKCCERTPDMVQATLDDWSTEYLDLILSVRVVADVGAAVEHINRFGSSHSDAIVTSDVDSAQQFLDEVDSAAVFVNASTRFSDGEEFGLGAEIGISTDKLHARGPMGLEELTTYKWRVRGNGQVRG
jgi:glutamate-5-semialdehyde dehydrogenase